MLVKKLITFICLYVFIVLFPFFGCYNHNDANNTSGNSIDKKINNLNEEYNYLSKTIPDRF